LVDSTAVILAATLAQTVVITLTLVVFILQFRSQVEAIKESSVQNLLGRYNDFIMSTMAEPVLAKMLVERIPGRNGGAEVTREEAAIYTHMLLAYGIMEEAYLLYAKKWITEGDWQQWAQWTRAFCDRPEFRMVHDLTEGSFDKGFHDFVSGVLDEKGREATQSKDI